MAQQPAKLTDLTTGEITRERLADWGTQLRAHNATPLLMIAIGHEHREGEIVVCGVREVDNATLLKLLVRVMREFEPEVSRER